MSFKLKYSKEVESARKKLKPVLALESTIIAHGMPFPQNLNFALEAESTCRSKGVTPATVAIIDGTVCVGLEREEMDLISRSKNIKKVSTRELGLAVSFGWDGATTVSSTMQVGRKIVRGEAVMVLSIDDPIPNKLLDTIIEVEGITNANPVTL